MKTGKSYIIWMPKGGAGKSRQVIIGPGYLVALSIALVVCILLIPLMQTHIFRLNSKLVHLEEKSSTLKSEIADLQYLKDNLARIEEKDQQLSEYFGIDKLADNSKELLGKGGAPEMQDYTPVTVKKSSGISKKSLPMHLEDLEYNLEYFAGLIKTKEQILAHTPNIIPVEKDGIRISSGFGWRTNPFTKRKEFHAAVDFAADWGTKIFSPANGLVLKTGKDKILGNYIVLQHTEEIKTIYGHLGRILVKEGKEVNRGYKIALMGNTGLSTNTHLHYMVVKNGRAVNPMAYILDMGNNL